MQLREGSANCGVFLPLNLSLDPWTIIGPLLYYLKTYSTFFNIPLNIWRKVEDDIAFILNKAIKRVGLLSI